MGPRAVIWPPHHLVLTTPSVVLRGMTEVDALALADMVPDDVEQSPRLPDVSAAQKVLLAYAGHVASWRADDWVLPFTVLLDGEPIGLQALEGKDFLSRRTIDSHSWLVTAVRGRGFGKQMRAAVLELGFDHLAAAYAVTEAWDDNHASLGVSTSLGYVGNGFDLHAGPRRMTRMVLPVEAWVCPIPVTVDGLGPLLPMLGL
jgi:RimJ/RimL family protein N-acetyltransferase